MFIKPSIFIQKIFPSLIWKKRNTNNKIWLTFDDGPCPISTPFILKTLNEERIKATFFLVGEQIQKYPKLFHEIIKNGHTVGNHSYSHKNGWLSRNSKYFDDIEKCQKLMPNNNIFRPPYGKISPLQIKYLKKRYKIILWDVLGWDFLLNTTPKKIKENILKNTTAGSIIVLHNNNKSAQNIKIVLKEIIIELKQKKFLFATTW